MEASALTYHAQAAPRIAELRAQLAAVGIEHREVVVLRRSETRPAEAGLLAAADRRLGLEAVQLRDELTALGGIQTVDPTAGARSLQPCGCCLLLLLLGLHVAAAADMSDDMRVGVVPGRPEATCRLWLHNVEADRNEEAFVFTLRY